MSHVSCWLHHLFQPIFSIITLAADAGRFLRLRLHSSAALAAENLFLRKQLALYEAGQIKPARATNTTRLTMVWLSHFFDWRPVLRIVKPETFTGWHRQGFRLFWRWKSKPGRLALPKDLQALIRRMALENPTWGQERIANELLLKLGLQVSPRTVRKYMPSHCVGSPGKRCPSQRWSTLAATRCTLRRVRERYIEIYVQLKMEGFWSLLRSGLRPHRGISQEKLPLYLGFFECVHNVQKRGKALLGALIELLVG